MPRWRAAEVTLERFGTAEVLIARAGGGAPHVVALHDARVLVACDRFDVDEAHAARVAEDVDLAPAEVVAALGRLRARGLLLSEDAARDAAFAAGARAAAPPGIAAVGVLSCDRPACVERALAGLSRTTRLPVWVCDDSRHEATRAATREVAARGGARFLGRDEKQRLAAALDAAGAPRELVALALFDPEGVGYTTGANRNAFRLVTAGRLSLLLDDDATTRAARPRGHAAGVRFLSDAHDVQLWFHDRVEAALADGDFAEIDLVAAHEELLGREFADCAARHGAAGLDLDGAGAAMLTRLASGAGRVLVTQSGHAGDAGIGNNASFLRLDGENRARLVARYAAVRDARALHRATTRLTVSDAPYLMGLTTGIDGRHLLPPWMPFLRNSDGVLAELLRAVHADGAIGHLPWVVEHRPPEVRRLAADAMIRGTVELRFAELLALIVRDLAPLPHAPPEDSLDALGRHLVALGGLPAARFAEVVRALRWEEAGRQARDLERAASTDDPLARDAAAALAALRAAMVDGRAAEVMDAGEKAQRLVRRFGELCRGWKPILDAAMRCDVEAIMPA